MTRLSLIAFLMVLTFAPLAQAKDIKCLMMTHDVGPITGSNPEGSLAQAKADALQQCVERRIALFDKHRSNTALSETQHSDFIDACSEQSCNPIK